MSPHALLPSAAPSSHGAPPGRVGLSRHAAALALRSASRLLDRLAVELATPAALAGDARVAPALLEFHAEAGAPEGALYVDGELVGWLPGVNRL